jgi:hypothetical protein
MGVMTGAVRTAGRVGDVSMMGVVVMLVHVHVAVVGHLLAITLWRIHAAATLNRFIAVVIVMLHGTACIALPPLPIPRFGRSAIFQICPQRDRP